MKQIANIIRKHWLPLLLFNSAVLAATIYSAIYTNKNMAPVWTATATLNLPPTGSGLNADLGVLGSVQNAPINFKDVSPLQTQLAILNSDSVIERVRALDPEKNLYSTGGFKKFFTVTPEMGSSLMDLEVQGSSKEIAHKRINTLLEVYQQRLNELRRADANSREQFSQQELAKAWSNLMQTQMALTAFQKSTGLTSPADQTKALVGSINTLKTTQAQLIAQAQGNAIQAQKAAAALSMTPQQAMNSLRLGENKEYQTIKQKLFEIETTLADARGTYKDGSPQIQSLLQKRQELRNAIEQQIAAIVPGTRANQVDTTLGSNGGDSRIGIIAEVIRNQTAAEGLQQQARQLQSQLQKLYSELNFIGVNQAILLDLQRRNEIADGVYKGIFAQTQQGKANPFSIYPNVQVLEAPTVDPKPIVPNLRLVFIGGILAAIFGSAALIFFLEARNPLLKPKDLQQVDFPILGSIPPFKGPNMEQNLEAETEIEFQRLASAILMREIQCLMVTSATSGEGKTTVTLGLALALVNFGFRVLIVDADLRQAGMSRRLGYFQTKSNANAVQTPVSVYPGLDLIPTPSVPKGKIAEFFARGSFEQRLNQLQASGGYDYVLVDSPPVGLACETNLISAVVRHVMFVVRSGTSDRYPVMDSLEQLIQHNARIMGLVINGVDSPTTGYRYGYGRQREFQETDV